MPYRFSTSFYRLAPPWLTKDEGEKVLFSLGVMKDAQVERLRQGLLSRFPSRAGESALTLLGQDRGIPRGRTESADHYRERLKRWRYPLGHRVRGNAFALLEQVSEYWGGIDCETIDVSGNLYTRTADGVENALQGVAWNWDGDTASWSRFWLVLRPPSSLMTAWDGLEGAWGGDLRGGRGYTLGQQGVTPDDVRAMRDFFVGSVSWKPAGTLTDYIVVALDGATLAPDGTWATIAGRYAAERAGARFWRVH